MIQVRREHLRVSGVLSIDMRDGLGKLDKRDSQRAEDACADLHPAWKELIQFCRDLKYGEIERLSIQDGLPVLAEVTKKKIKFK